MTDADGPERPEAPPPRPPLPERLRRRLDAVFGDVLPDVTRDEAPDPELGGPAPSGPGAGAERAGDAVADRQDAWLRANRPPHHDRD